jgi:hypothetical protein
MSGVTVIHVMLENDKSKNTPDRSGKPLSEAKSLERIAGNRCKFSSERGQMTLRGYSTRATSLLSYLFLTSHYRRRHSFKEHSPEGHSSERHSSPLLPGVERYFAPTKPIPQ